MWCTYSSICWSNPKRFLSILVVFGKCFVLKNFQKKKIQIFFQLCLLATHSWVASFQGTIAKLPKMVRDSLASRTSSHEKHLENFSKIWVFDFLATRFLDSLASREFIQRRSRLIGECKSENFQNLGLRDFGNSLAS